MMIVARNDIKMAEPIIEIIPMTVKHVKMLADHIRTADMAEILAVGFKPYKAVLKSYRYSLLPQSAFINGKIAAVWGVCGTPTGDIGQPWLLTTDEVYQISALRFARIYQQEVSRMLRIFPYLENYVDMNYLAAVRLLSIIGFTIEPAEPYLNDAMFHRFWKKAC